MSLRFLLLVSVAGMSNVAALAADVQEITKANRFALQGKEVDWIDGDYLIKNDVIVGVIARPQRGRDANMTVRAVGAGLIDLTRLDMPSDQLSAFYPSGGRYNFTDNSSVASGKLDAQTVFWRCESSSSNVNGKTQCTVEYRLRDGDPFISCKVTISGANVSEIAAFDTVRADRTFEFASVKDSTVAYCEDEHFRQTYGFQTVTGSETPKWGSGRAKRLSYGGAAVVSDDKKAIHWETNIYPASSSVDLQGLVNQAQPQTVLVAGAVGDQPRIRLSITDGDVHEINRRTWRSDASGRSIVHLPAGEHTIRADAIGHAPSYKTITVADEPAEWKIRMLAASSVAAKITDTDGNPIPCKVSFYGLIRSAKTADPNFGIDSQDGSVGNTVYSADGEFVRSIPAGEYEAVISYGPEYNAVFQNIAVEFGKVTKLTAKLERVVDTSGWVSSELHSHSSPSGDNTSSQLGRVENLVCEHLEFAPCTEHQRVESYDDQLKILGAEHLMATCSGMELTGSLLPINHQNAFPMKWKPHAQDGGGPRVDGNPVTQIARLAMWDDESDKIVQTNHPNMQQLLRDKNLDGKEDGGYSKMLDYMDVIEVHPPQAIFVDPATIKDPKQRATNRIRPWLDLINSGRRIPGVVNTDAHYNWHGSGWLRNWIRCGTDDPSKITIEEMIRGLEAGRVLMSTGPFMSVHLHHGSLKRPAEIGDDVEIGTGQAELAVQIQCANWLDVNRVEVFVGGVMQEKLSRRRSTHPQSFGDGVVKFDQRLPVELSGNTTIVVAAMGEKMQLGRVMGTNYGKFPPVCVSNPIYVSAK